MVNRNLAGWWREIKRDVAESAPVTAIIGMAAGAVGALWSPFHGGIALATAAAGSGLLSLIRTVPKRLPDPLDILGQTYTSRSGIPELSRYLPRVGIVGCSKVGKSTLVAKLIGSIGAPHPTIKEYLVVARGYSPGDPVFGLMDGAGESLPQQVNVCLEADVLIIVVDHTEAESSAGPILSGYDLSRSKNHEDLIKGIAQFIEKRTKPLKKCFLLVNKVDLTMTDAHKTQFGMWIEKQKQKLEKIPAAGSVEVIRHSNLLSFDVDVLRGRIISEIKDA